MTWNPPNLENCKEELGLLHPYPKVNTNGKYGMVQKIINEVLIWFLMVLIHCGSKTKVIQGSDVDQVVGNGGYAVVVSCSDECDLPSW